MTLSRPIGILLACLASACATCLAQTTGNLSSSSNRKQSSQFFENLDFQKLEVLENTSIGNVHAITQDTRGFIWFGSTQGISRYDGYRIKSFQNEKGNPNSIPHNNVYSIHTDRENQLWFGSQRGISRYNPNTESFTNYLSGKNWPYKLLANQVNAITEDSQGRILASTEAGYVYRYDQLQDTFVQLNTTPIGYIKSMVCDPMDRLWIGFEDGVIRYNPENNTSQFFQNTLGDKAGIVNNFVNSICYIEDTRIWIGTSSNGVALLNSITGVIDSSFEIKTGDHYIKEITHVPDLGMVVVANGSITLYDLDGTRRHSVTHDSGNGDISITGINTFYTDRNGNRWIASDFDAVEVSTVKKSFQKLQFAERNPDVIPNAPIAALLKDSKGNLWIGDGKSGLDLYPANGSNVIRFQNNPADENSLSLQPILKIFEDSLGNIWFGTFRGGLQRYVPEKQCFYSYLKDNDNSDSIGGQDIRNIAEDEKGNFWINTHGSGIDYLDIQTGIFTHYRYRSTAAGESSQLIDNWGLCMLYDSNSNLWVGTPVGVSVINTKNGSITNHESDPNNSNSLSDSTANEIFQDSHGHIWIGTDGGLNLYNPSNNSFSSYSTEHGLPHKIVNSIIEDNNGYLWLGTSGGLAKFDPNTLKAKSYDAGDGLASNEFFTGAVFKDENGIIYFGQPQGATKFNPTQIQDNDTPPEVFITNLLVFNKTLPLIPNSEDTGILNQSILDTKSISLSHDQKVISLEFIGVSYVQSKKNKYTYMLEGFDPDWSPVSSRRSVTYTNLNPGTYTFRVKASNNDGYWNEEGASLEIRILPPFWGTPWFIGLAVLTAISIPSLIVYWRVSSIKQQKRHLEVAVDERTDELAKAHQELESAYKRILNNQDELESTVKKRTKELEIAKIAAEQSDRLKSAFLANMSHEIRTPMNAIIGFLHFLQGKKLSVEERSRMNDMITQSSDTLLGLIDDILDLSTIEAGEAEIINSPVNVRKMCTNLHSVLKNSIPHSQKTKLILEIDENNQPNRYTSKHIEIDPLRLKQILTNLITNAIKFTENGEVKFGYKIVPADSPNNTDTIVFKVKDSGIGIPEDQLSHIFNRFHKIEKQGNKIYRGTGLGLTISKKLTELMNGKITVLSTLGVGTEFTVTLPYRPIAAIDKKTTPLRFNTNKNTPALILDKATILVAEDESPNFEYIKRILAETKIKILRAENGAEALQLFEENPVDIVLLDLKMPVMDGYETAKQIRKIAPDMPIITQSAYAMTEDKERSLRAGANQHITKPFSPDQLLQIVAAYLAPDSAA